MDPVKFPGNLLVKEGSLKKILILSITGLILISGVIIYLNRSAEPGVKKDFEVHSGEGLIKVASRLENDKLIISRHALRVLAIITGRSNDTKKGLYVLESSMSPLEILALVTSGRTKSVRITIPEGYNMRQIADQFVAAKLFRSRKEFIDIASSSELLKKYNIQGNSPEGYLFPDTYEIPLDYKKEQMVEIMIDQFFALTKEIDDFPTEPEELHNLVILASIVEREAQKKEERELIAGVFANRLSQSYPLESCATIQYLFEKPKKRLYFKDLEIKSPYNTYLHAGLPPGPISNPGVPSIIAALHPKETDYMFFVVRPDGSHQFSKTFNEHVKAKKEHLTPP